MRCCVLHVWQWKKVYCIITLVGFTGIPPSFTHTHRHRHTPIPTHTHPNTHTDTDRQTDRHTHTLLFCINLWTMMHSKMVAIIMIVSSHIYPYEEDKFTYQYASNVEGNSSVFTLTTFTVLLVVLFANSFLPGFFIPQCKAESKSLHHKWYYHSSNNL